MTLGHRPPLYRVRTVAHLGRTHDHRTMGDASGMSEYEFKQLLIDAGWTEERFEGIQRMHNGDRTQAMKTLRKVAEIRKKNHDAR